MAASTTFEYPDPEIVKDLKALPAEYRADIIRVKAFVDERARS